MNPDICPTHLVPDSPADADAFGAHLRIADAIADLIETSAGGQSIGLLGTWGAGKSTVVRLLQTRLEHNARFIVWVFDAWAHEGDSLRRMFLERLIERLTIATWLQKDKWQERLEILAKRRKVTEQANRPHFSRLAILLAVSVLFVPIGGALFGARLDAGLSIDVTRPFDLIAVLALLLSLAPLCVVGVYIVSKLLTRRSLAQVGEDLRDALTVFIRQTDSATSRTETLESGEPTSLEFERAFQDVAKAALAPLAGDGQTPDTSRRLVIVIDNLDRVNTEQALAVWSTLQTFVGQRETRDDWRDRLWCLLPFDGDAIRRLWHEGDAEADTLLEPETPAPRTSRLARNPIAESFLDKTFQIRFEVPPPLLSNWKDYLLARLEEAMPRHSKEDDFFRIYRLYAVRREQGARAPTPRELKLFVNQVGSLHRQWQDEIPLPDLAYYALLQRDQIPIDYDSISRLPNAREAGLVTKDVRQHVAAVAFGVPISSAQELLLTEPIMQALEVPDPESLGALAKGNEAFPLVFEQALWRGCAEWPQAEGGKLLHAALAIDEARIHEGVSASRADQWFEQISAAIPRVRNWAPMSQKAVGGILVVSRRRPHLAPVMFRLFVENRTGASSWGTPADMPPFISDYMRLASGLKEWVPNFRVDVRGDATIYGHFAAELIRSDPEGRLWASFAPQSVDHLIHELSEPGVPFGANAVAALRVARAASPDAKWSALAAAAAKRLSDGQDQKYSLAALHALWDCDAASSALREIVESRNARGWLFKAHESHDYDLAGAWLFTIARGEPSLTQLVDEGALAVAVDAMQLKNELVAATPTVCEQIARAALQMGDAGTLFGVAERTGEVKQTMRASLLALAALGPPVRVLRPELLLQRWDSSFYDADPHDLAMLLTTHNPDFAQAFADAPFTWSSSATYPSIYAGVLDAEVAVPESLIASCLSAIQNEVSSAWLRSLGGEGALGRLVAALVRRGARVVLGESVAAAFKSLAPKLADLPLDGAPWRKAAFDALDSQARAAVVSAILDSLFAATDADLNRPFDLVGPSIVESPWFTEHADAFAIAARVVLADRNEVWLAALARAASTNGRQFAQANPQLQQDLAAAFDERRSSAIADGARDALRELGATLVSAGIVRSSGPGQTTSA